MRKFYTTLCKVEQFLCGFCLCAIVALVFVAAILRAFNRPIQWSIDVAQFMLPWLAFMGADMGFRESKILGVDMLTLRMPKKLQSFIKIITNLIILALLLSFVYFGTKLSYESRLRVFQSIHVSYSWVTISLPVCSLLMSSTVIINIHNELKALVGKKSASTERGGNI